MRYSFTISPSNAPSFILNSDDRDFNGALATAKMFQDCYPDARVKINRHS